MAKKQITYQQAISKAMNLCSKSEKCISDIRKKLFDWSLEPSEHNKVIIELKKQQFIDEERFAKFYVRDKFKFNKWGRVKIKAMLFQKQIPERSIYDAIEQISEKDYIETLENLIKNKEKQLNETDTYKKKNKLLMFATNKGFEPYLILQILDN